MDLFSGDVPPERHYLDEIRNTQGKVSICSIPELRQLSSRKNLGNFNLLEALDLDERPTFAIDFSFTSPPNAPLDIVYCNPALIAADELLLKIKGRDNTFSTAAVHDFLQLHAGFKSWSLGIVDELDFARRGSTYLFAGYTWFVVTISHYKIVSGVQSWVRLGSLQDKDYCSSNPLKDHSKVKHFPELERFPTPPISTLRRPTQLDDYSVNPTKYGPFDCTLDAPPANVSDYITYFRNIEWSKTPLGSMCSWSPQLRCIVNVIMGDSYPAVLFWGDEVIMIYNEPYIDVISLFHPCMGQSARVVAPDHWIHFQPWADHINATGETLGERSMPILLDRNGFLEETYFTIQFIPILDDSGHIAGYYQPMVETTKDKLLERRLSHLVEIGTEAPKARNMEEYWKIVTETLAQCHKDAPFALLYGTECSGGPNISSMSSSESCGDLESCVLKGSIGVTAGHQIAPSAIDFRGDLNPFVPHLLSAAKLRQPMLIHFEELPFSEEDLSGIDWKGYGDSCRSVIVCPLQPTTSAHVQGFLILGVNPRRPYDEDYKQFVQVMIRLLSTSLASVALFDEELRQREKVIEQATRIQEELIANLELKEKRFQRFAERSDVAISIQEPPGGHYTYRNQRWFDMFPAAARFTDVSSAWKHILSPEDIGACEENFLKLVADKMPISFELRTSLLWTPPPDIVSDPDFRPQQHFKWIICSAYPEFGPDNEVVEIVGNVTDISKQKWAEGLWKTRSDSAQESKRHLEHFIDTTSHEMRNPLSAIMQCADGILSTYCAPNVENEERIPPTQSSYAALVDHTLDAAQTIAQCAQHMKRIVDDVLTVSKLDSGLLVITPVDVQPLRIVEYAVKMFENEAKSAGVDVKLEIKQAYRDLDVDLVSLDPTRTLQILINLISNAVKFTRLEKIRHITISISASLTKPSSIVGGVQYIDTRLVDEDPSLVDDWKQGSLLYIQFSITDTGRGLTDDEKSKLFSRFSQASPRTHIHYGGSGLGLFISRRLTDLQGGAIGLASQFQKGSSFSFYIKARRANAASQGRKISLDSSPEDIRHRANTSKEIDRLVISQSARPTLRRSSAIHSLLPAEAMGIQAAPVSEDSVMKEAESVPDAIRVLIVEDNLVNQKVLAKQLTALGCVVSVANHGLEAIDFIKKTRYFNPVSSTSRDGSPLDHTPAPSPMLSPTAEYPTASSLDLDIILMDWEMPVMDGLTAVTKIREMEREHILNRRLPVIGVTANVRQQQIETALNVGMDDIVGKPFRVKELLERMKTLIASSANADATPPDARDGVMGPSPMDMGAANPPHRGAIPV